MLDWVDSSNVVCSKNQKSYDLTLKLCYMVKWIYKRVIAPNYLINVRMCVCLVFQRFVVAWFLCVD